MAVASRANATTANSAGTSTSAPSVTKPAGTVSGDVVVLVISAGGGTGASITAAPTGFTLTTKGQNSNGANIAQWVYYRVCDGSEAATFGATLDIARPWSMVACGYTGVDAQNPISGQSSNTTSPSSTAVVFANYNQHVEADFLVNAVSTRNTTAARTVTTASSGFTKQGDTSNTVSAFTQTAIEDSATLSLILQLAAVGNTTMSAAVLQTCTQTIGLRAAVTNTSFDIDVGFRNAGAGALTLVSDSFKTGYANEIVLVMAQCTTTASLSISTTLGGTLGAFSNAVSSNANGQTVLFWALATTALTAGTITLTAGAGTPGLAMTIYTIRNMDTSTVIGATTTASGATGAPSASVTTTRNASWVWGAVNYQSVTDSTLGAAQTKLSSENNTNRETVQRQTATTATSGTSVTINNSAPSTVPFDLIVAELLPVAAPGGTVVKQLAAIGVG